jgi:hypothetical protein
MLLLSGGSLGLGFGRHQTDGLAHLALDADGDVFVLLQEIARILTALADALTLIAEPGAGLLHDVVVNRQVQHVAFAGDSFAVEDVELRFAEWRSHFVFDYLDLSARANHLIPILDGGNAADIHADRGVELQRAAAGGGLGIAEHNPDFFANLVNEDQAGARL